MSAAKAAAIVMNRRRHRYRRFRLLTVCDRADQHPGPDFRLPHVRRREAQWTLRRDRCQLAALAAGLLRALPQTPVPPDLQELPQYPLGFLFGLGFDTATEIGLLGISAAQASQRLSLWSILVFPALFTVGMSLVDTADAVLMLGAYGWVFIKPLRKPYYNMIITFMSVVMALLIGGVEAFGLLVDRLGLEGGFLIHIGNLNGNFGEIGFLTIGIFIVSWPVSAAIYRIKRYGEIDVRVI